MMPLSLNNSTFLNSQGLKWNIYRCIIDGISKSEAINLLKNAYSSIKNGSIYTIKTF